MTDNRTVRGISSATDSVGGGWDAIKAQLLTGFGRAVDAIEPQIGRAPSNLQPAARKAVAVARERPLLTMAGLAVGALMLARSARRR